MQNLLLNATCEFHKRWEIFQKENRSFPLCWTFDKIWYFFTHASQLDLRHGGEANSHKLFASRMPQRWLRSHGRKSTKFCQKSSLWSAEINTTELKSRFDQIHTERIRLYFSNSDDFFKHVVRLTPAVYATKEASFPYWKGQIDPETTPPTIDGFGKKVAYSYTDTWENHAGTDPKHLLALVSQLKNTDQMVAVHCRAGIGRTGTFLAAYALLREIDLHGKNYSIDKIVWEISLQCPFAITHFPQYETLYRLADLYIQTI